MDPLTVSITVDAPREQVFAYLQDIANHAEFSDHYMVEWHLLREDTVGRGAGARFRIKTPRPANRFDWGDMTFIEVLSPYRIVGAGRRGKFNRVRTLGTWELTPGAGDSTEVAYTVETEPHTLSDRLLELVVRRSWARRKNAKALRRLRSILETGEGRGRRPTISGR